MVQVENEYGFYGNVQENPSDRRYMQKLISTAKEILGYQIVLFTTDFGYEKFLKRGSFPGGSIYTVGDTCKKPGVTFRAQHGMNERGKSPNMCSEIYTGWMTRWGEDSTMHVTAKDLAQRVEDLLKRNSSFALYMAHGGSNFGFWSGAAGTNATDFQPMITSYDYSAPIAENGHHGVDINKEDKFIALRRVLERHWNPVSDGSSRIPAEPDHIQSTALFKGKSVKLSRKASLLAPSTISALSGGRMQSSGPIARNLAMEKFGCYYGLALYSARLPALRSGSKLTFPSGPRDRAQVFIDGRLQGVVYRTDTNYTLALGPGARESDRIDILVENKGRINFAHGMDEQLKGLPFGVLLNDEVFLPKGNGWEVTCLPLHSKDLSGIPFPEQETSTGSNSTILFEGPSFFWTTVTVPEGRKDSFIDMEGWGKGYVWVNSNPLGRYWTEKGPQNCLYVPAPFLDGNVWLAESPMLFAVEENPHPQIEVLVLELDRPNFDLSVRFASELSKGGDDLLKIGNNSNNSQAHDDQAIG